MRPAETMGLIRSPHRLRREPREQMHAERVDGFNPLAVIDAYRRKKAILEKEGWPRAARRADLPVTAAATRPRTHRRTAPEEVKHGRHRIASYRTAN